MERQAQLYKWKAKGSRETAHHDSLKQVQAKKPSHAGGDVAWRPANQHPPEQPVDREEDCAPLTESDVAFLVRCAREFLSAQGPSEERDLHESLGPRLVRQVQCSYGSLAACLVEQPGFHHQTEGELSFVYYLEPDQEDEQQQQQPASKMPEEEGRASPCSSSSSSYATAPEELAEEEEQQQQHTDPPPAGCRGQMLYEGVTLEAQGLPQWRPHLLPTAAWQHLKPAKQPANSPPRRTSASSGSTAAKHHHHHHQSSSSNGCRCSGSSASHIGRIVDTLKKKRPGCSEADIRQHMDQVRRLMGGFSYMRISEIVALILRHMDRHGGDDP